MTQNEELYEYLKTHDSITPLQALYRLGIYRLSARISNLKDMGINIKTERLKVKARNGRIAYVGKYSLVEEKPSDTQYFKDRCPYTNKKCDDWNCQLCSIEKREKKWMKYIDKEKNENVE